MRVRGFLLLLALPALLAAPACGPAGAYPKRPISLICPWGIGGGTDAVARVLANHLEREIRQPVAVINRTGGGGAVGHTAGARALPDGYTITMMTVEITTMHQRGLARVRPEDFAPILLANYDGAALFVRSESPWKTLGDLLKDAKARPGALKASGTAIGGIWHLACLQAVRDAALPEGAIRWVPSNGAGPALRELEAAGADMVFCSLPEAKPLMESGRLICLGVMSEKRFARFPEVPTFAEQGVNSSRAGWRGVAAPRGTPPDVLRTLGEAFARVVANPDFRKFMETSGYDARIETGETFLRTIRSTEAELAPLIALTTAGSGGAEPGPWLFPVLLGSGLVVAVAWAVRAERRARLRPTETSPAAAALGSSLGSSSVSTSAPAASGPLTLSRVFEVVACVLFFIACADTIGFLLAAGLPLFFLLCRMGSTWALSAAVATCVTSGVYILFAKLLRVPLPGGWIGF